jgi:zinc/manganese transport system substrate-binding protein
VKNLFALLLLLATPLSAQALNVFVCEPEWGSLVSELAGQDVDITVATTAVQDPHQLQARPSLIAAMRTAELVICTGADLEIGWLPLLLRRAGNKQIQPGNPGYFLAGDYVRLLEVPKTIDRAQGDVHPQGNPHVHLHPRNVERVAKALSARLTDLDPANTARYKSALDDFTGRWSDAQSRWDEQAEALRGMRLASHHRSFSYLADWLDLDIVATLESKPGIPPSAAQLAALLEQLTPQPPVAVIRTPYENEKPSLWLSGRLDIPVLQLPYTLGGTDGATDLFSLYDETIRMLLESRR